MTEQPKPVAGLLLDDDSETSPALRLLLARMDALDSSIRQEALRQQAATEALKEENKLALAQVQRELAEEKARSTQAYEAVHTALTALLENRPVDNRTRQQIIEQVTKESAVKRKQKRQVIRKKILAAPKGEILHLGQEAVPIGIHGIVVNIQPGVNKGVPQPFIDEWEKLEGMKQIAREQNRALQGKFHNFGKLQTMRAQFSSGKDIEVYDLVTGGFEGEEDDNN